MSNCQRFILAFLVAGAATAGSAQATLIGDQVQGLLVNTSPSAGTSILTQFSPTAIVGPGVEFSGQWQWTAIPIVFNISVDLDASSFTVTTNSTNPATSIGSSDVVAIVLSDLDLGGPITGVSQTGGPTDHVKTISFTANSITVNFSGLGNPASYTFTIQSEPVVGVQQQTWSGVKSLFRN
jgi:hypothetical protein